MRLIDADAYAAQMKKRQDACMDVMESDSYDGEQFSFKEHWGGVLAAFAEAKLTLDDMPTIRRWVSVKEVASIIADLFGDKCACNNNDTDEWLPKYCEYRDTDCPNPPGASCWEQYLKHLDKKPKEEV